MKRDEVIRRLRDAREQLEPYHVKSLFVFGSVARDEATDQSDVDLLVDFEVTPSLFVFARVRRCLGEILGVPVDLVTRPALRVELRERILSEAIRAT